MIRARRLLRWLVGAVVALVAVVAIGAALSRDVRFVIRAAWEEIRILARRRPIDRLIAGGATAPPLRDKLALVLAARAFGADSLGLDAGDTYTTYSDIGRDTLVLVLSASPRTRLDTHYWWFPIVGNVPYHGYFSLDAAKNEVARMERDGFDTYLRPAVAFSTLGWFSDPLLSTMAVWDSVTLVNTVLHEITHNTIYQASSATFNESFANFVGGRGVEAFFRSAGDSALADRARRAWMDDKAQGDFFHALAASLDSLYSMNIPDAEKLVRREPLLAGARETLRASRPVNNATVVAARVYLTRLALFDSVLTARAGNLRAAIADIVDAVRDAEGDPYSATERLLSF